MSSLTDTAEARTLDWLTGNTTTAPVLPLKLHLVTANGDDATPGTEVTGDAYTPQTAALAAASGDPKTASNSAKITFPSLDSTNSVAVVGVEVWDSAGTPVRWWHGPLTTTKTIAAGDPCEFGIGALDLTLG